MTTLRLTLGRIFLKYFSQLPSTALGILSVGSCVWVTNCSNVLNLQTLIEGYYGPWGTERKHRIWFHSKEREVLPGNQSQRRGAVRSSAPTQCLRGILGWREVCPLTHWPDDDNCLPFYSILLRKTFFCTWSFYFVHRRCGVGTLSSAS